MTPSESTMVAELASLFALGFRRLVLTRQKALEAESHSTALCIQAVNARDGVPGKDQR